MAAFVMTDTTLWFGTYDLQTVNDEIMLEFSQDEKPVTTFGSSGWKDIIGGLRSASASCGLLTDYATADFDLDTIANMNTTTPVSVVPDPSATPAIGDTAMLFQAGRGSLGWGGSVGDVHRQNVTMSSRTQSDTPLVAGELAMVKGAYTATETTAGRQVGAISAGQKLYAALHVFATTGSPTWDVTIESDDNSGFTTATTRITFSQLTAAGSAWSSVAGAITDDYWRVVGTFGGTGSVTAAVTLGIA